MEKSGNIPKSPKVYIALALFFVVLLLVMPRSKKFNFDYKKGTPWAYEALVAQFDFPILKTEEQLQHERNMVGSKVVSYYKYSDEATHNIIQAAEKLNFGSIADLKPKVVSVISDIYSRGVISDSEAFDSDHEKKFSGDVIFVQKDGRASKIPSSEVFSVSGAQARLLSEIERDFEEDNLDSLFSALRVYSLFEPNLMYDKETTELIHAETADYISPTQGFMNAGQLIVSKGEIVTAEIQQLLDSYRAEYENSLGYSGPRAFLWIGNALIALALVIITFFALYYTNKIVFTDFNRYIYLLMVVALASVSAIMVDKTDPELLYMAPFSLTVLYLLAFFKKRVVLPIYVISLLPLLIFTHNGIELFVMYLVAGVVTMYIFAYFNRGWRQFVVATIAFLALLMVYVGFRLINDASILVNFRHIFYLFLGSMLSVAGYPLVYLFEKVFMLVSNSRLMELCDTNNNKLLYELAHKAPGTFQHSLQVMNMADAAAMTIDANNLLVKTGALYHDIGKIMNPQCFIENETYGTHYHADLSPRESAKEIIKHVSDGLVLADKYKLPEIVKDFIRTHHGTTFTEYFYSKYIDEGGDPADAADFYYPGGKPTSKEQVIIMLCDTLEAASRTLKDNSPEAYDQFVEKIVASKMKDGQFEEADISLKELNTVKTFLKSYLRQMYHARVVYPKRK